MVSVRARSKDVDLDFVDIATKTAGKRDGTIGTLLDYWAEPGELIVLVQWPDGHAQKIEIVEIDQVAVK